MTLKKNVIFVGIIDKADESLELLSIRYFELIIKH